MTYAICFFLTPLFFTIVKQTSVSGKIFLLFFAIFATFHKILADIARILCFFLYFIRFLKQNALQIAFITIHRILSLSLSVSLSEVFYSGFEDLHILFSVNVHCHASVSSF